MNIRYKVYYITKEEDVNNIMPQSWRATLPYKRIRANSEDKAREIFKAKHPDLVPIIVSLY